MFRDRFLPALLFVSWIAGTLNPRPVSAQTLFQNNNQPCETEPVTVDATSVSCRNRNLNDFTAADFNGDAAVDCATGEANFSDTEAFEQVSILINRGAAGNSCGDQFETATDHSMSGLFLGGVMNIVTGILNDPLTDLAMANVGPGNFFINLASGLNPGSPGFYGPDLTAITTIDDPWQAAGLDQTGFPSLGGEHSLALLACDPNPLLDAVTVVESFDETPDPTRFLSLNSLLNNGTGADPLFAAAVSTGIGVGADVNTDRAVLTSGDFNGDDISDVAVASFSLSDGGSPISQVITLCVNDGSCGFTCSEAVDLSDVHPGQDILPNSLESGDFDGNGTMDLVVTEPGLDGTPGNIAGVHYFSNDGNGAFTPYLHANFPPPGATSRITMLTTGCFNNDNVADVAVAQSSSETNNSQVRVFTSDGTGGVTVGATLTPNLLLPRILGGLDAADFDAQGGDDVVLLANNSDADREAHFFMNTPETILADAGADTAVLTGEPLVVTGASCSVTPEIAGDPARFEVSWSLAPAAGATLAAPDQINPTFTATQPGTYVLTLSCRTRCHDIVTDDKVIAVAGPPVPTPTPTPPLLTPTQGGCLAALSPAAGLASGGIGGLACFLPALAFALFRMKKIA